MYRLLPVAIEQKSTHTRKNLKASSVEMYGRERRPRNMDGYNLARAIESVSYSLYSTKYLSTYLLYLTVYITFYCMDIRLQIYSWPRIAYFALCNQSNYQKHGYNPAQSSE